MVSLAQNPLARRNGSSVPVRKRILIALAWWEERIVAGIARFAAERNWTLDCSMRLRTQRPTSGHGEADGVIAYSGVSQVDPALDDFLQGCPLPKVWLHADRRAPQTPVVALDNEQVGRLGAAHLLSLHLENFAFVQFDENPMELERREGFAAALAAEGRASHVMSRREFVERLGDLPKPIGVMAANDVNAMEVISACIAAGVRVPEDVAVVGVDNSEISSRVSPVPITSVACDFERQGYEAAALLERCMQGLENVSEPTGIPPLGVVVRRSSDTIAIADPDTARALRFLRDHFREPIRIKELAREMCGRMRRVQSRFRAETGRTMAEELMRLRVEHAKKLLEDRTLKIEGVALQSGFANRFHFNQAFRRATGKTPRSYRTGLVARVVATPPGALSLEAGPVAVRRLDRPRAA